MQYTVVSGVINPHLAAPEGVAAQPCVAAPATRTAARVGAFGEETRLVCKVGIAGLGVIGARVAKQLTAGIEGMTLSAVVSGDSEKARRTLAAMGAAAPVVSAAELARDCDVIVECAPTAAFLGIVEPALDAGRTIITVSAAALIEHMEVIDRARATGGRVIIATGALLGLDAVRAAALGEIRSVTMITRKPPKSLRGAPHLAIIGVDVDAVTEPTLLFDGTAREGARGFPANVNVAASLALAGVGPDLTRLQIWADPTLERNTHTIKVDADSARFEMTIENVPSVEKPGTGRITALSVIAALEGLSSPLKVGS
jgi:aspartate dehydrogenase